MSDPVKKVKELDHKTFLCQTFWKFQMSSLFTDFIIVCSDGEVPVHRHKAMIVGIFKLWGIGLEDREEFECLFIPDVSASEMVEGLKMLYLNWDTKALYNMIYSVKPEVGHEVWKIETSSRKRIDVSLSKSRGADTSNKGQDIKGCKMFPCRQCKSSFKRSDHLKNHIKRHRSHVLGFVNSREDDISRKSEEENIKASVSERSFACTKCESTFYERDVLKKHMKSKHDTVDNKQNRPHDLVNLRDSDDSGKYEEENADESLCDVCGKTNTNREALVAHIIAQHSFTFSSLQVKSKQCPICKKTFHERYLGQHLKRHNLPVRRKNHACTKCESTYYEKKTLNRHMKTNHGMSFRKQDYYFL
eukprot:GFUD01037010.1.p1 GENE.GFUD01037010.1~~GFUD01037010.1.p1  ORF type:complete len:360 (+),score=70.04 GFUD01037010.1:53-1132(+)